MLTDYALQTIYGPSYNNNGSLNFCSSNYQNYDILDNYGYKRGTVDNCGRIIDNVGNTTGFRFDKGTIFDSFGSSYGSIGLNNRVVNNLSQDLGYSIKSNYSQVSNNYLDPILPKPSLLTFYKSDDYLTKPFGFSNSCEYCGKSSGHSITCRNRFY